MSRALKPKKLDSEFHRSIAENTEDGFGGLMLSSLSLGSFGWPAIYLAGAVSAFWLFLIVPAVWIIYTVISHYKNTVPLSSYTSDNSIYGRAYGHVTSILEENSYADAKELMTNIWEHEKLMGNLNKHHDDKYHCPDCWKRFQLIMELRDNQPIPSVDGSDIERIEQKLKARKELAA